MVIKSMGLKEEKSRLIILTDMENEPDDSQTMVRLLMYANEVDIEGLIAVTSCHLPELVFPESIAVRVQAYGIVRKNLVRHAPGWPTEEYLMERVAGGQRGYGMKAVGDGKSSPGSERIISAVDADDPRPIWIAINAGANTLAQALWDVRRTRSPEEVRRFVEKLRVYDDSGQDDAGAWICSQFPDIFYIRSRYQVFGLYGPMESAGPQVTSPLDHYDWAELNVRTRHGILGALYPQRQFKNGKNAFLEGGGTTTWLALVNKGLAVPEQISWGGWGGRFSWKKEKVPAGQALVTGLEDRYGDYWMYPQAADDSFEWQDSDFDNEFSGLGDGTKFDWHYFAPVWRWRQDTLNDFKARMDWCVTDYQHANHPPIINLFGDENRVPMYLSAQAGETFDLDASLSRDPDDKFRVFGDMGYSAPPESISFRWYSYPEAGTYAGPVIIEGENKPVARFTVPADAEGTQIHLILEVSDHDGDAPLKSYRRIVIDVEDRP